MPLTDELQLLSRYRENNPELADLSDVQLADAVERTYPGTFAELPQSSVLQRFAGRTQNVFGGLGKNVSEFLGDRPGVSPVLRVPGRVAGMLTESAPEIALQAGGAFAGGRLKSLIPSGLASLGSGVSQYYRTQAEGGGESQNVAAGVSSASALPLTLAGASIGKRFGPLGRIAGAAAGGLTSDLLELGIPLVTGSKDEKEQTMEWLNDPVNIMALGVANSADVVFDIAKEKGEATRFNVQQKRFEPADIYKDQTLPEVLGRLRAIPAADRTELETERLQRLEELSGRISQFSRNVEVERQGVEQGLRKQGNLNLQTIPESSATLAAQFKMMQQGKKSVVMIPSGTKFKPNANLLLPHFKTLDTPAGRFFYDPSKTNEASIQNAVKTDTLGELLGYGVPWKPDKPNGKVIVLRSPHGVEKAAVAVGDDTEAAVRAKLQELADEGDVVRDERIERTLALRKARQAQIKSYSLQEEPAQFDISDEDIQRELAGTAPDKLAQIQEALKTKNLRYQYTVQNLKESFPPGTKLPKGFDNTIQIDLMDRDVEAKTGRKGDFGANLTSTNRKLLAALGIKLPKAPEDLPSGRYDLEEIQAKTGKDYSLSDPWSNSLIERLSRSVPSGKFTLDAEGNVGTAGIKQAMTKWASPDILEHLNSAGMQSVLTGNKVNMAEFSTWLKNHVPAIEVKRLMPKEDLANNPQSQEKIAVDQELGQLLHQWETLHPDLDVNLTNGHIIPKNFNYTTASLEERNALIDTQREYPNEMRSMADRIHQLDMRSRSIEELMGDDYFGHANATDSPTGRFGIEPKRLEQMDDPVDILVRVPLDSTGSVTADGDPRYEGRHFGASDVNIVASVRGYMQGDTFVVYEVQSDWGQAYRKNPEDPKRTLSMVNDEMRAISTDLEQRVPSDYYGGSVFNYIKALSRGDIDNALPADIAAANKWLDLDKEVRKRAHSIPGHPLLRSYETLGIKTAIRHALEKGATKIAIVDPETAMIIERHDQHADRIIAASDENKKAAANVLSRLTKDDRLDYTPVSYDWKQNLEAIAAGRQLVDDAGYGFFDFAERNGIRVDYEKPTQEGGMRQHYGQNLPNILKKLTGDKGKHSAYGQITTRGPSKYFNNKGTITARTFDLSKVDAAELNRTFSIYEMAKQGRFEHSFYGDPLKRAMVDMNVEAAKKDGKIYTTEEFMNKILAGQNVEHSILFKYLSSIVRQPTTVRGFNLGPVEGIRVWGENSNKDGVSVNLDNTPEGAFAVAAHELSHQTLADLQFTNPALYNEWHDFANGLNADQRRALLADLQALVRGVDLDLDYLSGSKFDPAHADTPRKIAMELSGAIVEILARSAYSESKINPTIARYLSWLSASFQRLLTHLLTKVRSLFGSGYPSTSHMLTPSSATRLQQTVDLLSKKVLQTEEMSGRATNLLKKTDAFNPELFISDLPYRHDPDFEKPLTSAARSFASPEARDYSLEFLKESGLVRGATSLAKRASNFYEDNFFGALMRTRTKPFTTGHFLTLHHYRPRIKQKELRHMAVLGQDAGNTLTLENALDNWDKYERKLTRTKEGAAILEKQARVIEKDTEIRERLRKENPSKQVTDADLTSVSQMETEYGLKREDAEMVKKYYKMLRNVADQTYRDLETTDIYNTARLFFNENNSQNIDGVLQKTQVLQLFTDQMGEIRSETVHYKEELARSQKVAEPDKDYIEELKGRIGELEQQERIYKEQLEMRIRQLYQADIQFDPIIGEDVFINQVAEVMTRMAEHRTRTQFIMRDAGYAPMTRRGKFLLRVFDQVEGQPIDGTVAEMHGFDSRSEAEKFIKKRGFPVGYYELIDKETIRERSRLYYPSQLQSVRDKAKRDFNSMIEKMRIEARENPRPNQDEFFKTLQEIETNFRPLQAEINDVISDKGDKFVERRWNVPGFDRNDFVPNIFEYLNYRTVVGEKAITRAKAKLEMSRPEIQGNAPLFERLNKETDYVLNKSSEAAGLRKFIFNWYLGASIRHIAQNAFQIPLVGIPQMVADGTSYFRSVGYFMNASKLAAEYSLKGTTGDKVIDAMLKQADAEGVTLPSAIEMFSPQTDEIQAGLDRAAALADGRRTLGTDIKAGASALGNGLGRLMRSSAVASETANRRITFIMSALKSRHEMKGKWDVARAFNDANLFTDLVNFVGDKSNRPGFLIKTGQTWPHGPLMVWSALQTFTLNQLGQLYTFAKKGFSGSKADRKALATSFAHLLILAGAMGLVGAETVDQLFEQATGISLRSAIRRGLVGPVSETLGLDDEGGGRLADGVLGGLPGLLGIDASGSVGLGSPFFRFQAEHEPTALDVVGPVGGVIQKGQKALQAATSNPWNPSEFFDTLNKVSRAGAPQALNQFVRMLDAVNEDSYFDQEGKPIVKGLDMDSVASIGLGFTPTQVSNRRQVNSLLYKSEKRRNEQYDTIAQSIANMLHEFDQTQDPEKLVMAQEMFQQFVRERGGTQDRSSLIDSITSRVARLRSPTVQDPSMTGLEDFQEAQSAYPDVELPFQPHFEETLEAIQRSSQLGQVDDTLKRLTNLTQSARSQVLFDSLVEAGLPPPLASLISQRGIQAVRKLVELQALSSPVE